MRKSFPLLAGGAVLLAHLAWRLFSLAPAADDGWGTVAAPLAERFSQYLSGDGVWLGLSYALAAWFTVFALFTLRANRRKAAAGAAGGAAILAGLYGVGCFMLGCCGSPMLAVYLGLFGAKGAGLAGPLMLGLTAASVGLGWWWMRRKQKCGCGPSCCGQEGPSRPEGSSGP